MVEKAGSFRREIISRVLATVCIASSSLQFNLTFKVIFLFLYAKHGGRTCQCQL